MAEVALNAEATWRIIPLRYPKADLWDRIGLPPTSTTSSRSKRLPRTASARSSRPTASAMRSNHDAAKWALALCFHDRVVIES